MATNFGDAKTQVAKYLKRPDWLTDAGEAINDSVRKLQNVITDFYATRVLSPELTYTSGSETMDFKDSLNQDINKIISINHVSTGQNFGTPLRIYTYEEISNKIQHYDEISNYPQLDEVEIRQSLNDSEISYGNFVSNTFGYFAYMLGTNVGLYPKPAADVKLRILYSSYLPLLVDDSDTNDLLVYCWDFIFYSSLVRLNLLLSESERIQISQQQLSYALTEAKTWNASLKTSNPID